VIAYQDGESKLLDIETDTTAGTIHSTTDLKKKQINLDAGNVAMPKDKHSAYYVESGGKGKIGDGDTSWMYDRPGVAGGAVRKAVQHFALKGEDPPAVVAVSTFVTFLVLDNKPFFRIDWEATASYHPMKGVKWEAGTPKLFEPDHCEFIKASTELNGHALSPTFTLNEALPALKTYKNAAGTPLPNKDWLLK
jgi:hypothetical protein